MYMNLLGKLTDSDLDKYSHVHLTGPHEWDPSVLDYTHPPSSGGPAWTPNSSQLDQHAPRIDEYGNFKGESSKTSQTG